jgi:hypothetical protein
MNIYKTTLILLNLYFHIIYNTSVFLLGVLSFILKDTRRKWWTKWHINNLDNKMACILTHPCLLVHILTDISPAFALFAVHIFDVHRDVGWHIYSRFLGKCYEGEHIVWLLLFILYMSLVKKSCENYYKYILHFQLLVMKKPSLHICIFSLVE